MKPNNLIIICEKKNCQIGSILYRRIIALDGRFSKEALIKCKMDHFPYRKCMECALVCYLCSVFTVLCGWFGHRQPIKRPNSIQVVVISAHTLVRVVFWGTMTNQIKNDFYHFYQCRRSCHPTKCSTIDF